MTFPKRRYPVVAIDGPAGAGKSTVSSRVAQALGYHQLDTGAIYRCVAWRALQQGVVDQPIEVARIADDLASRKAIQFQDQNVLLDGVDVTTDIRQPDVGMVASRTSSLPQVRHALLAIQREVGAEGKVVVEGRDIGSVVFPDAEAKFYLTASTRARAERRFSELVGGLSDSDDVLTLESVETEVRERDRRDSSRPVAPLIKAPDAIVVDSTHRGIDEVVAEIVDRVRSVEARMQLSEQRD